MSLEQYAHLVAPELLSAIEAKGFDDLTAVQRAVLDPALDGQDLRITSQTGSGKTVAIGLSLRSLLVEPSPAESGVARPLALVIAPTRELAHQTQEELSWLFAERGTRLATTTGGASYRDEHRALARGPSIVVGTPGRLLDHLKRGSIDPSQVSAVVLDEADRILELGFREDLLAILETLPAERRTHLVSATFPQMVRSLADRVQQDAAHVEGSRLGAANVDIDHVIHIVDPNERMDALVNLLLAFPDDQTLVFVRTRADAGHVANELVMAGFAASGLSGEMDQTARNRTLAAFKQGGLRVLIATDVAARGIDAQNVTRVVHAELPTNPDAYTHRSGRTGRAGRKGTSSLLVAPAAVVRATRLLRGLRVQHRVEPIPGVEQIERSIDQRLFAELTAEPAADSGEERGSEEARWLELSRRLIESGSAERTLARLLARTRENAARPRRIRVFAERPSRFEPSRDRESGRQRSGPDRSRNGGGANEYDHRPRYARDDSSEAGARQDERKRAAPERQPRQDERGRSEPGRARGEGAVREPLDDERVRSRPERGRAEPDTDRPARDDGRAFTRFRVSWGRDQGADARRMLAMVCRRGEIRGRDVGAIDIDARSSIVEVAADAAEGFERAARRPDPREPKVLIRRDRDLEARSEARAPRPTQARARAPGKHSAPFKPRRHKPKTESAGSRPLPRKPRQD